MRVRRPQPATAAAAAAPVAASRNRIFNAGPRAIVPLPPFGCRWTIYAGYRISIDRDATGESSQMKSARSRALIGIGVAIAITAIATVVYLGRDFLFSQVTEQSIEPEFVTPVGADGSLLNVEVGFPWTEPGYCDGQFQVKATESATQIRISPVTSRTDANLMCAGLGSNGKWATAPLSLRAPIGKRTVIRDGDRAVLPVFALTVMLPCRDAIDSQASPGAEQMPIFNEVALPKNVLQANRSGDADPSARLFAKSGLEVASRASFTLSVPDGWMGRVSIGWGNPAIRTMNLYVPSCGQTGLARPWLVFAGGFWVAEPACVPILVNSGTQQETVEIGIGMACPGQAQPPAGG